MKLTAKARRALPSSAFGIPSQRKYPEQDRGHAIAAKGRAAHAEKVGRISKSTEEAIDRKANAKLGKGHSNVRNAGSHESKLRYD